MIKKCEKCKNVAVIGGEGGPFSYLCDVVKSVVEPYSYCDKFDSIDEISLYKPTVAPLLSPGSAGFRGYELSEKSTIKATNGYLIWIE